MTEASAEGGAVDSPSVRAPRAEGTGAARAEGAPARKGISAGLRWTSLRMRLVVVFGAVALLATLAVSGIAYWLNRESVLTRTQDAALSNFRQEMQTHAAPLPPHAGEDDLRVTAQQMAQDGDDYTVLLTDTTADGHTVTGASRGASFSPSDIPASLHRAVEQKQRAAGEPSAYHVFWQRVELDGTPYLVGGTEVSGGGPTGYLFKSLAQENSDLDSLAWSLGIATACALVAAALLAHISARTVLKPVQRLGEAARKLGEGQFTTRLTVSGKDELADLSRTFNSTAASLQKQSEELQKQVAEMSARDQASRRFVADMSHELRTPLTALTAVTEVLEDEIDDLDPMMAQAVGIVVSETRRLGELVENLMEVTRFDAGTARLVLDDVDVADQVTACIDARAWLDAVELDAERGIMARLDPRRLDVILANLIGNALKHGGSPVRVSVRTEGDELVVAVRDHGPGIPAEVLPHVFDRFYKASASRPRSDGSGLGLSIAMENANVHGGTITASNAAEGGAVFVLRLPRDGSRAAQGPDGAAATPGGGDGPR